MIAENLDAFEDVRLFLTVLSLNEINWYIDPFEYGEKKDSVHTHS